VISRRSTAKNLIHITSRTPVMYFLPKFTNLTTQVDLLSLLVVVPPNSSPVFLIVLWHPWLRTYHPISRIPIMLSKFSRTFIFMALTNSFSPRTSNPYTL
jgi:hypothetical protein